LSLRAFLAPSKQTQEKTTAVSPLFFLIGFLVVSLHGDELKTTAEKKSQNRLPKKQAAGRQGCRFCF
jgi:hypothetical protein